VLDVPYVNHLLLVSGYLWPPGLRPVPVGVPLQKRNLIFAKQLVKHSKHIRTHLRHCEVQHELGSSLCTWTPIKVNDPVWMLAIQVAVLVDHLRLDPQTEVHAERMHAVDQRLQPMREFVRVRIPVAQTGMVVLPRAEPAIVHDEPLNADGRGLLRQLRLAFFRDPKLRRFPRVVQYRTQLWMWRLRQHLGSLKFRFKVRHLLISMRCKATVKLWRAQRFPWFQGIREVE